MRKKILKLSTISLSTIFYTSDFLLLYSSLGETRMYTTESIEIV